MPSESTIEAACPRPDKRQYATREVAERIAGKMNGRDGSVPAVAYECCCGWWHVGRDKVYGTAICAWCGVEFRYLRRHIRKDTPPRWCKPTHATKGKKHKRARIPEGAVNGQRET
jgi:hypothetical protein